MWISSIILAKLWGKKCRYPLLARLCENRHFHSVFILCWWDKIVQLFGVKLDDMYTSLKMWIASGPSTSISKNFILKNNCISLKNTHRSSFHTVAKNWTKNNLNLYRSHSRGQCSIAFTYVNSFNWYTVIIPVLLSRKQAQTLMTLPKSHG